MLKKGKSYPVKEIELEKVSFFSPRKRARGGYNQLVDSIRRHGLINPATVVALPNGEYELIKGQGRCEAMAKLGHKRIRAFVIPPGDVDTYEKTVEWLVENRVRKNLPPVVVARLAQMDKESGDSFEQIGSRYGVSPSTARQYARVAEKSSEGVLKMVEDDRLDFTRAKAIAEGIGDKQTQEAVAEVVADDRLSQSATRAVVKIAQRATTGGTRSLRIPELRREIEKIKAERRQLSQLLAVKANRLEELRRQTRELAADEGFVEAVRAAELRLVEEAQ